MSQKDGGAAAFTGLVDLAAEALGGRAVTTNDDFFAGVENLLKPGRGVFIPDEYTDRGKWMDGWESRRRREPGHDFCVIELGVRGVIRGLDLDTNHFLGNHAPYASVEAAILPFGATARALDDAVWTEILPQSPLRPGSQNLFAVHDGGVFTHVRLHIYPDGGVARFRVYGDVVCDWDRVEVDEETKPRLSPNEVDLAAVKNGGLALSCSDMFFGNMNNLIGPGRAPNMGDGWETRRRRGPGHDWILLRLADRGSVGLVEIDTNHFKGNYPDRAELYGLDAGDSRITDLISRDDWTTILPTTKLAAHTRHFFRDEVESRGPFTHLVLRIYPDGGVSRLRIWGLRADDGDPDE
jgi:allantoicase